MKPMVLLNLLLWTSRAQADLLRFRDRDRAVYIGDTFVERWWAKRKPIRNSMAKLKMPPSRANRRKRR